jgi:hypothetical protein
MALTGFIALLTNWPKGVLQNFSLHAAALSCNEPSFEPMPVAAGVAGATGATGACAHRPGVQAAHTANAVQNNRHVFMDRFPHIQGLSAPARTARGRRKLSKKRDPESLWPILRFSRRATLKNVPKLTTLCSLRIKTFSTAYLWTFRGTGQKASEPESARPSSGFPADSHANRVKTADRSRFAQTRDDKQTDPESE